MAKKLSRSQLVKKCDRFFSIFIRLHYADSEWYVRCFTCWKKIKWNDPECSCGHWIPRSVQFLRWDFNNARPQCMWKCNSKLSGNWEPLIFRKQLAIDIGIKQVEKMENEYISYRQDPLKFKVHTPEIEQKIEELKGLIHQEEERLGIKVKL